MDIQVINSQHSVSPTGDRHFVCEMRCGKRHATVVVAPKYLDVYVHNASNRAWGGPGRHFKTLEDVIKYYKTPELRAMAEHAATEWKNADPGPNSTDAAQLTAPVADKTGKPSS